MTALRFSIVALVLAPVTGAACAPEAASPSPVVEAAEADRIRRLGSILDYVAADYGGAVVEGHVVNEAEYAEQLIFVKDARALAEKMPHAAGTLASLERLDTLVKGKAPADEVAHLCRSLRNDLFDEHGIVLAPASPPSRSRGEALYRQNCVPCHGATGAGDGPEAARLDPPPRSFHDPEVMKDLTPARAWNALTDGIDDTSMASWGVLPASDRWSLAFYVFGLRHDEGAAERGRAVFAGAGRPVAPTATRLAGLSDGEILDTLAAAGVPESGRMDALAYLRSEAPYQRTGAPMDAVREKLAAALSSYESGDRDGALQAWSSAYLNGFEPHEATLGSRDPHMVIRIENQFQALREAMESGAAAGAVEQDVLRLGALLDNAEERLASTGGGKVAFVAALVIIVREGVEAALLILLLLGLARRAGADADKRMVHAGWIASVVAGGATWLTSAPLMKMSGASREILEGVIALLAAAVLLYAGHFVLARLDARRRIDALKQRFQSASPAARRGVLFGLAFAAVYREAFEVVLFLRAILLDATTPPSAVAGGVAAGFGLCVVFVVLLGMLGRRLNPGPFLTASGTLLCVIAVILAGKGIRALQEAGVVSISPLAIPRIDWLGLFPTLQGVLAQVMVLATFLLIVVGAQVRARREAQTSPV